MLEQLILVLSVGINLTLVMVVLAKDAKSATNRLFAILALILAAEPVINYFSLHNDNHILYIRLVMFFVVWMGFAFRWLVAAFPLPKIKLTPLRYTELLLAIVASSVAMTPYMFSHAVVAADGTINPVPQPGIILFVLSFSYTIGSGLWVLARRSRVARGRTKAQLHYVILGAALAFGLSFISNFFLAVVLKLSGFVVLTPLYLSAFAVAIAMAIVKYRLFNLRLIVARSIAYFLLLGTLALAYVVFIFGVSRYLFPNSHTSNAEQVLYVIAALVVALTFQPLRRFFEQVTDKIFFHDRYDSQKVLDALSQILVSELDLDQLLERSLKLLASELHISFGQFVIFDKERVYRLSHHGPLPSRLMVAPQIRMLDRPFLLADDMPQGERRRLLEEHSLEVSIQLKTRDEYVGQLLFGAKLSGESYSAQDQEVLQIAAKQLAIAIQNAKAYLEIQTFADTLQQRVNHATNRLRVANRHLKELDQAKDEFISMASHQLRTPLTTIKGYLSMMLEGDAGEITDTQRQFTGYAFEGADRMVNLIADLLNVSRLSAGRFMIEARPSDLGMILSDEVRQLQSHATAKKLSLELHLPKKALPLIPLDDNKTRQVIMNFIDNAIYYTKEGTVSVTLSKVADRARVTVVDSGIGVPLDARKKLFSKFYRADNAQTVRPDGTGLGLYLAKRVIEDQGGTIIFESVEGKGSTFGFELPLNPKPAAPAPTKKAPTSA